MAAVASARTAAKGQSPLRGAPLAARLRVLDGVLAPASVLFGVRRRYEIFEHHLNAYVFFLTEGMAMACSPAGGIWGRGTSKRSNDREQTERLARSIEADGLQVFVAVNPTFFAVDADFYPDVVGYSQPDSVFPFFPRH